MASDFNCVWQDCKTGLPPISPAAGRRRSAFYPSQRHRSASCSIFPCPYLFPSLHSSLLKNVSPFSLLCINYFSWNPTLPCSFGLHGLTQTFLFYPLFAGARDSGQHIQDGGSLICSVQKSDRWDLFSSFISWPPPVIRVGREGLFVMSQLCKT